jgi:guanylate kinase
MVQKRNRDPIIFLFSAPSGTGKGTIVSALLEEVEGLSRIVTATSRRKREGEIDGTSYRFIPREEFEKLIREGAFVEWNEIYGDLYGTLRSAVDRFVEQAAEEGRDLLLEIDVDGKRNFIREYGGDATIVSIFLVPPSLEELERRMTGRKAETLEQIEKRLARARMELERKDEYDYCVVNDSREAAVREVKAIIQRERDSRK